MHRHAHGHRVHAEVVGDAHGHTHGHRVHAEISFKICVATLSRNSFCNEKRT